MAKKKSAIKTFFKFFMLFMLIIVLACAGITIGSLVGYVDDIELLDVDNLNMNLSTMIYYIDESGNPVEFVSLYDDENRVWANLSEIPQYLQDAFVSIEDERFYSHHGFDIKRIIGAASAYLTKGSSSYGASTITQQLIKNITNDDDVKISRKLREIYRAYRLEKQLSKKEILEYYLNTIYLSQNCNGVKSAALVYFGKDVSDLTLSECASIAGITQFPSKYDPIQNPENNKSRRNVILKKMKELGYISENEYNDAINEELVISKDKKLSKSRNSYFVDAIVDELLEDLTVNLGYSKAMASKLLYSGGLKIYATIDPNIQKVIDKVYSSSDTFPIYKNSSEEQPESAIVVMDHSTGYIKGMAGGRGTKEASRTLNRATHTLRQPGSSIKPIAVYAPGIEYGKISPSTVVTDSPFYQGNWSPKNSNGKFLGNMTVREAIMRSTNIVAVKVCNYISVDTSFNFLKNNMHISSLVNEDRSLAPLALGGLTKGVSVKEMAAAYSVFPNKGMYIAPTTYSKVLKSDGTVLIDHKPSPSVSVSEQTAYLMTQMLRGVVTSGTGTSAGFSGMSVAGKTGTTTNNYDRWFCGFTPYYTAAVWFGFDNPKSVAFASGNPSAVAFRKVMSEIHKDLPNKEFSSPSSGVISYAVCEDSGLLPTPNCPHVKNEVFTSSTVPNKRCTIHGEEKKSHSSLIDSAWLSNHSDSETEKEPTDSEEVQTDASTNGSNTSSGVSDNGNSEKNNKSVQSSDTGL